MNTKPTKLLIIGGYGMFGGRLARLLAEEPQLNLMISGRSLSKASDFTDQFKTAKLVPVAFDRDGDVAAQLATLAPDIVVDASGPFQAYGDREYRVAEAAIAVGANYLDLADSSEFVAGIESLDAAARENDAYVMSGVSTCPALTMAVTRSLCSDLASVESISGGIAPSPFARMGKSVVQAIAGYAGKSVRVFRYGGLVEKHTFVSTRKFTVSPPGVVPLTPLTFSLIDVPDLRLFESLPLPVGNTWFGVATQPGIYHLFLRWLARGVKAGFIPTLKPLAGIIHFVMNNGSWGEHRGGMFVEVNGTDVRGKRVCRSWHLIAEGDDGPYVPAFAVVAIVRRHIGGRIPASGARTAANALDLADYEPMFTDRRITTGERPDDGGDNSTVFSNILGNAFDDLGLPVRTLHTVTGDVSYHGHATITRGGKFVSRLIGSLAGIPNAGEDVPVVVHLSKRRRQEIWQRDFNGKKFTSEMTIGKGTYEGLICERIGPAKIGMALVPDAGRLRYVPRRWSFLGIPMPRRLMPVGDIYEMADGNRFVFHVEVKAPLVGHVVTYHGYLNVIRSDTD